MPKFWNRLKTLYDFFSFEDELFVFASSLSFYTIFALIPLLLIALSVLLLLPDFQSTFAQIQDVLISYILPTHAEVVTQFLNPLFLNRSKMGMLGFVYILLTSILFFRNYESITSRVFASTPRKFFDSLSLYWMIVTLFPLFIGISFYFVFTLRGIWQENASFSFLFQFAPIFWAWLVFLLLFKVSANKKLNLQALMIASLITSLVWNIAKWVFVYYVAYNHSYETLYGSVSFVLFVMMWIYVSWFIVLLGMRACEGIHRKKTALVVQKNVKSMD